MPSTSPGSRRRGLRRTSPSSGLAGSAAAGVPAWLRSTPAAFSSEAPYYEWTPVAARHPLRARRRVGQHVLACKTGTVWSQGRPTPLGRTGTCSFRVGRRRGGRWIPLDRPYLNGGLPGQFASPQGVIWGGRTAEPTRALRDRDGTQDRASPGTGIEDPAKGCAAPGCNGAPATPVLSWDHQPGAGAYMVYIGQDANFTTSEVNRIPVTSNTKLVLNLNDTVATLPENEVGFPYYWYVRPCTSFALSTCGRSPENANLPGSHSFSKTSPAVNGLTSSDPAGSDITFSWQDYLATNRRPRGTARPATSRRSSIAFRSTPIRRSRRRCSTTRSSTRRRTPPPTGCTPRDASTGGSAHAMLTTTILRGPRFRHL